MRPASAGRPKLDINCADIMHDVDEDTMPVKEDTLQPFVWHGFPLKFFEELVEVNNAIGVVDFPPGDGLLALAALTRKNPVSRGVVYCGFCHTEQHADELRAHLTERVFKCMQDEGNELYQAQCVTALSKQGVKRKVTDPPPKPKG